MEQREENLMEKIVSLCKRRGFIFPGSEIYGGLAGTWDYGPLGVELKNNIKQLWWKRFVQDRDDVVGIDAAIIMNAKVWEQSGHVQEFTDPLIECKVCNHRFRIDQIEGLEVFEVPKNINDSNFEMQQRNRGSCPECHTPNSQAFGDSIIRPFNLLFRTFVGAIEDSGSQTYLRPETAQAMFVNFKNVLDATHKKLPFGIAQIGKAFRNEITPRDFIFRSREFEQMEIEYFVRESAWAEHFDHWLNEMRQWIKDMGIDMARVHELEVPEGERAHYSKRTVDFEYDFPFGKKELYGLAYRGDFDLTKHFKEPPYREEGSEPFYPHVIEPSLGVDRTVLAILLSAYDDSDPKRIVLKLASHLAPYKAAVFPLVGNKEHLTAKAKEVYHGLKKSMMVAWDDRGNIGKRYYSQDEIGTPFCITVDYQTLEDDTVTVRDRDTMKQERVSIKDLSEKLLS